jgi:hypothetical protein
LNDSDRLLGILLFLPVPLVLFLFTQAPLGVPASLGVGVAIMVSHRLYARPFALARAGRRCLWCGSEAPETSILLEIIEPLGATAWRACGERHLSRLRRTLGWAERHALFLKAGILGNLLAFLAIALVAHADAANLFRFGIAATVLPFGILGPSGPEPRAAARAPFPVHIQALIGTAAVLWLFRIVGIVWLVLALSHAARRVGLVSP